MAPSPLSLLSLPLLFLTISTSTSRFIPSSFYLNDEDIAKSIPSSPSPLLHHGPIKTQGRYYKYACNPHRFATLGLDMNNFGYCNKSFSYYYDRVDDLIGRMNLNEKVQQISDYSYGLDRIGLPEYKWYCNVSGATQFPAVINSAASFNESLWKAIAQTVSTEARAMYNLGHAYQTFWSPVINVARDPRWGRIMETPGEDPYVIGKYSVNFVRDLQDIEGFEVTKDLNTRPIKVASCCKHFAAYDLEYWLGSERFSYDARVYFPAYCTY